MSFEGCGLQMTVDGEPVDCGKPVCGSRLVRASPNIAWWVNYCDRHGRLADKWAGSNLEPKA